ncbi:hypothetical protein EI555_017197 [Monodon monoceros]|uniref:Endoplasmic reticulum junction formation protein lunapark n=1 Tax=Monodon monoceros TaxID=40151 RepID=A0A4U1FIT4_MONMO|nr:hypothetical protein EI555_017197 [Monodon monoceros]
MLLGTKVHGMKRGPPSSSALIKELSGLGVTIDKIVTTQNSTACVDTKPSTVEVLENIDKLEEVMEKETYKTAKLILERFDPDSKKAKELEPPSAGATITARPGQGLHPPGPPLARPILPRERGALDRIVEYLVGDGPQNRYALICQQCFSHNGMALKEEFEYIAFRCAYCFFLNPARKTRPQAPRLPEFSFEKGQTLEGSSTVGSLPSGSVISSENQISEESLEEQDVLDNSTEQTDDKIPDTEQTDPVIEQASGTEKPEEKQEETKNEETSMNKAKSTVPRADAIRNPELSGESSTI